jgi:hypothetical protein
MKKNFIGAGIVVLSLAVCALFFIRFGNTLDVSSQEFVNINMGNFFSTFSKDDLVKVSTVALQDNLNNNDANFVFSKLKRAGQFQKYEGSKGEANIAIQFTKARLEITAAYAASAVFRNGTVQAEVRLIRTGTQWQIDAINFDSPIFEIK